MNEQQVKCLIGLSLVNGLGAARIMRLMEAFPDLNRVFKAEERQLLQIPGVGKATAAAISRFGDWQEVDRILSVTEHTDAWLLTIDDEHYPKRLRHIYDPPLLLWGRGDVSALSRPGIAVIGTRKPTVYGRARGQQFSRDIAGAGLSVISGLAYGVDTLAHAAALDAGGVTVAVLGSGIDRVYPSANRALADKIATNRGAVISEFAPGTKPDRENFPVRNRVVSGLSYGALVVESATTGGSMITAYSALDQGREVFAIPHDITNEAGSGGNTLIKKGHAKLTMCLQDILEELRLPDEFLGSIKPETQPSAPDLFGQTTVISPDTKPEPKPQPLKWKTLKDISSRDDLRQLCQAMEDQVWHIDDLAEKLNKPGHLLLVALLELEMMGCVKASSGKRFQLV
ncbi:DNA processing protein [Cyclonatronum proteinivorum]|uniref:DNA processing protein n=1 Tax=Cyclonatronum proteinivorum TaxID=1457365 RepID=A0A345UK70_9BACT|nr:DNA-processing protein DprA [Cyclonatronum proteinivorum]AXJ00872.1 DNA processing protein [Cyclonatronum proteinivorum]